MIGAEARVVRPNGSSYDILISAAPLRNAQQEIIGAVATFSDITSRKQMETALRESEARYRARSAELESLMEAIPAPVWIAYDRNCHDISGNRAAAELLGMGTGENLSATPPPGAAPPPYQVRINGQVVPPQQLPMQRAAATGQSAKDLELEFVRADGVIRWAYGGAVPLFDDAGRVRGCVGSFLDITACKHTENALRASEERLRLALDSGRMGTWVSPLKVQKYNIENQ